MRPLPLPVALSSPMWQCWILKHKTLFISSACAIAWWPDANLWPNFASLSLIDCSSDLRASICAIRLFAVLSSDADLACFTKASFSSEFFVLLCSSALRTCISCCGKSLESIVSKTLRQPSTKRFVLSKIRFHALASIPLPGLPSWSNIVLLSVPWQGIASL